jgi:NADH-quinone oxidoreductase subunit L
MLAAWLCGLTIVLPWAGALLTWRAGDGRPRLRDSLAVIFAAAGGVAAAALIPNAGGQAVIRVSMGAAFGMFSFVPDGLGVTLAAVAALIGALAVVFSLDYMRGEAQLARYYALVLLFIGAMAGLVLTSNLLLVFAFWEITALCSYALISFHNDDPKAVHGGVKALVITQLGGIGLLAGALLIYTQTGSFDLVDFLARAGSIPPPVLGWIAFGFLAAAAAKSAQFPFQTWLPDAMEAPTPISALIHAATMVNAGVYLMLRFYPAFQGVPGWTAAVCAVGTITALLAAVMAAAASDLKRVLAYSTVSQLGFLFFAAGAGGLLAGPFHLLSHSIFKALLFLGAGAVIHAVGTRDMRQMGGLRRAMPVTFALFSAGALALAGIPPFNGFWSKEFLLEAGLAGAPAWCEPVLVLTAGLTAFYSLRCVAMVFLGPGPSGPRHAPAHGPVHDAGKFMQAALWPLAVGALLSSLLAGPFSRLLASASNPAAGSRVQPLSTGEFYLEILRGGSTYVVLAAAGLGVLAWVWRARLAKVDFLARPLRWAAEHHFGFEAVNRGVTAATVWASERLRLTQTGLLNWNIAALVATLVLLLLGLLIFGA